MKNKEADVLYCNVDKEKIKEAQPTLNPKNEELFFHWISERYKIHYLKDVEKKSAPWTKDLILKKYRFTNVKRYHDKETIYLIENIVKSDLSLEEKILNVFIFRAWNKSNSFKLFGGPWKKKELAKGPDNFREKIETLMKENPKMVWFTNAFNTGSMKSVWGFYGFKNQLKKKGAKTIKLKRKES
jgi:hypothetical protein